LPQWQVMPLERPGTWFWASSGWKLRGSQKKDVESKKPLPCIIGFVAAVVVAGMMRHVFAQAGADTAIKGLWAGFGLRVFIAAPWIATNYAFAGRSMHLMFIDGLYATIGCAIMGLILTLF
jgi:uncharacterized protein DUF1761